MSVRARSWLSSSATQRLPECARSSSESRCGSYPGRITPASRESGGGSSVSARESSDKSSGIPELLSELSRALTDDPPPLSREAGVIRPGYDPHRDSLDDLAHSGKRWVAELESHERARTDIGSLKVGFNRVFGYYLEVTRPHLDKVPPDYERRQTLTSAERFVTAAQGTRER